MITIDTFKGMDNRHRADALPEGYVRDLINLDVDDEGKLALREGAKLLYAGDVHSLYKDYFVEGGALKQLQGSTAIELESGVGDTPMSYTSIGAITYFSNGVVTGKIEGGSVTRWGVQRPPEQPRATATSTGDLFAGDYQVAITWIDYSGEESGSPQSALVSVEAGGGIRLDQFITPPEGIALIGVYLSQANSETLYLYREYPRTIANLSVGKSTSDIPLRTQFSRPPEPSSVIQEHYGRIYMAQGSRVYFTEAQNYGLVAANNFWAFEDEVQVIASLPGMLYVVTKTKTFQVSSIDSEAFPIRVEAKPYGGTAGSLSMDTDNKTAYWLSGHGLVAATEEGVVELHHGNVAASTFDLGATTVLEKNGSKRLVGAFQGGRASNLQSSDYEAGEILRKGNAI